MQKRTGEWVLYLLPFFPICSLEQRCITGHGHAEPDASLGSPHQDAAPTTAAGRKALRQGRDPEDADQEAQEAEFGESKVRLGAPLYGQGDGGLCARRGSQSAGAQHRVGARGKVSGLGRSEAQVCARRLRLAACHKEESMRTKIKMLSR